MIDVNSIIRKTYNATIRRHLPTKLSVHNGVAVRNKIKLLDFTEEFPDHEKAICQSLKQNVCTGDSVVIVGGGSGVSSVVAANQVGECGCVKVYEGSQSQFNKVDETIKLNQVENRVKLHHAVVGEFFEDSVERYGEIGDAQKVSAESLPECDILELDCEGAEMGILESLEISPDTIIVETHGFLGTNKEKIRAILKKQGYRIVECGKEWEEKGVYVLTAVKKRES